MELTRWVAKVTLDREVVVSIPEARVVKGARNCYLNNQWYSLNIQEKRRYDQRYTSIYSHF